MRLPGVYHGCLTPHKNITLDCRIIDLDSVDTVKNKLQEEYHQGDWAEGYYLEDFRAGDRRIRNIIEGLNRVIPNTPFDKERCSELYRQAYDAELQPAMAVKKPRSSKKSKAATAV